MFNNIIHKNPDKYPDKVSYPDYHQVYRPLVANLCHLTSSWTRRPLAVLLPINPPCGWVQTVECESESPSLINHSHSIHSLLMQSLCALSYFPMEEVHPCRQASSCYCCHNVCMIYYKPTQVVVFIFFFFYRHFKGRAFVLLHNSNLAIFRRFPGILWYIFHSHSNTYSHSNVTDSHSNKANSVYSNIISDSHSNVQSLIPILGSRWRLGLGQLHNDGADSATRHPCIVDGNSQVQRMVCCGEHSPCGTFLPVQDGGQCLPQT